MSHFVTLALAQAAWAATLPIPHFTRLHSELPDYDTYRVLEKTRLREQQRGSAKTARDPQDAGGNRSLEQLATPSAMLKDTDLLTPQQDWVSSTMDEILRFLQANQVKQLKPVMLLKLHSKMVS